MNRAHNKGWFECE